MHKKRLLGLIIAGSLIMTNAVAAASSLNEAVLENFAKGEYGRVTEDVAADCKDSSLRYLVAKAYLIKALNEDGQEKNDDLQKAVENGIVAVEQDPGSADKKLFMCLLYRIRGAISYSDQYLKAGEAIIDARLPKEMHKLLVKPVSVEKPLEKVTDGKPQPQESVNTEKTVGYVAVPTDKPVGYVPIPSSEAGKLELEKQPIKDTKTEAVEPELKIIKATDEDLLLKALIATYITKDSYVADRLATQIIINSDKSRPATIEQGIAMILLGKYSEAVNFFNGFESTGNKKSLVLYLQAICCYKAGDVEQGDKVIAIAKETPSPYGYLGINKLNTNLLLVYLI